MGRIVLIDGENLLYGLRTLAGSTDALAPRDQFFNFPFRRLINEVLGDDKATQILYYGARLKRYDHDEDLKDKTTKAIKFQLKLANTLQKQRINFIKAGYLRARETDPCPDCARKEWKLLEKGVDVALAVRMVTEAKKGLEIVLISSDTDLLPAVLSARQRGAKIIFVGYEYQPVIALVKSANLTRTITAPMVRKYFENAEGPTEPKRKQANG